MYNEFYGFSENPFESIQDPAFLFLTPSHQETIASIIGGIRERRSFMSVVGEVGTGKTVLTRFLISKLEAQENVKTVLVFHPTITFEELLRNVLMELDLEVMTTGKKALIRQLHEYLIQRDDREKTLVILLDEAQDLSNEVMGEIGMLAKVEGLQVVFIGQPEFEDKLNSQGLRQLKQKIGIRHQIKALDEKESRDYIDHRLGLVGSSSSQIFTPKAISMICSYARGIPRIIDILCDNVFLTGYRRSMKKIDVDIIQKAIKDMESPFPRKTFLAQTVTTANGFRIFPFKLNFLRSKTSLIILSLLCLGGLVFFSNRYFLPKPAKISDMKLLSSPDVHNKSSSRPPQPQEIVEEIPRGNIHRLPGALPPTPPESNQPGPPTTTPVTTMREKDKLVEIVTVEEGQTMHSITRKYYRMVNRTLMDLILVSNPEIADVHLILVDQKIKIPKITEELLIIKSPENTYEINAGTFQTPIPVRLYNEERALRGKKIKIHPRQVSPQDTWYQVVIGKFDTEDEALKMIVLLKEKDLLPAFGGLSKME